MYRMQYKRLKISIVLFLGLVLTELQAQTMYVKENNGTQTALPLSNIQKMTFTNGNVQIHKTDNSTGIYALSGVKYLSFSDLSTSISKQPMQLGNTKLLTYPNPIKDVLNIDLKGVSSKGILSILTLEGKVLKKQSIIGESVVTMNLCQLPQGIYLCRFANSTVIKTVKIIKK